MFTSFVLINTKSDAIEEVKERLEKIASIKEVHTLYGVYDLIAKVNAETMDDVKTIIPRHIRRLENIRSAITMITYDDETSARPIIVDPSNSDPRHQPSMSRMS